MKAGEVNAEWHDSHRMSANPSRAQRIEWHAEHSDACGCRPVPPSLAADVKALNRRRAVRHN